MKNEIDMYTCENCGDGWHFCPEDFEEGDCPEICPFCIMPLSQMIKEIYQEEGLAAVVRQIWKRYFKATK